MRVTNAALLAGQPQSSGKRALLPTAPQGSLSQENGLESLCAFFVPSCLCGEIVSCLVIIIR